MPVAVKDSVDLAGTPTRSGSAATSQEPADADAEPVRRLREAGALLVGKTSLPELGLWPFTESTAFGVARNLEPGARPRRLLGRQRGRGGGGHGPDRPGRRRGGSIRIPASNCGLVGSSQASAWCRSPPGPSALCGMSEFGPLATTVADLG